MSVRDVDQVGVQGYVCWLEVCKDMCVGKCMKGCVCVCLLEM